MLHLCVATVTSRGVEIRPPCPPIASIPSFVRARRRVYLTATLADDSILVTDLGADPALLARAVTPGSAAGLGDRLILAPVALNPSLTDESVRVLAQQFARGDRDGDGVADSEPINVVVLVPGTRAAAEWAPYADRTYYVKQMEAGVAELKARHVGVVVLVNKYDGVDLPHRACQLLILDGVPRPMDGMERREAIALTESPTRLAREVQRIEKGMGRGVRDTEDYCAVLLLGANLGVATHDPRWLGLFSPATRAQLRLSRDIATQIKGQGLDAVRVALSACLTRDPQWVERSRRTLAEIRYVDTGAIRPEAVAAREAFDLAVTGQTHSAADKLQQAINNLEDPALRGWLREQKAAYLHFTDPVTAQQQLGAAVRENNFMLRPAAWERLGLHLGFVSSRPEKLYGTGPDTLWSLSADRHAVVELKTGCTTATTIAKKDLDQLGGSIRWDQEQYPSATSQPIMLHPSSVLDEHGTGVPSMRVVTPTKLEELKLAVVTYAVALADGQGRWGDEQAVAAQLSHGRLDGGNVFQTYAETPRVASRA